MDSLTDYDTYMKQAPFTNVDVDEKFRRVARRDNAKRKDHRTTGNTFERVAVPYTRTVKHRLTNNEEA